MTTDFDLDWVIDELLQARSCPGANVKLKEADIRKLISNARSISRSQPMLLRLEGPLKLVGSINGQFWDLLRLFELGGFPPEANYLFLGNYIDGGKHQLETICLLLAYKIKFPYNFFLLRGNHECADGIRASGFDDECKRRYSINLWKLFSDLFNVFPVAAIIDKKIFAVHSGLSPDLHSFDQIERMGRPTEVPTRGLLCDLLWSEPVSHSKGWSETTRGVSFTFGPDVLARFLARHKLDLVVRSHRVVDHGFEFFGKNQLVTLFSAPMYRCEYGNAAAMMSIDESLLCSFEVIKAYDPRFPTHG